MDKNKVIASLIAAVLALPAVGMAAPQFSVLNTAGTADVLTVTDTGMMGIGTSAPARGLNIFSTSANIASIGIQHAPVLPVTAGGGALGLYFNYGIDGLTLPRSGDRLGTILFGAATRSITTTVTGANIAAKAEAQWTDNGTTVVSPSYLVFNTTPAGTTGVIERVRVTGSGYVGIGATAPSQKLEVNGGIRLNPATAVKPTCDVTVRGTMWFTQGAPDKVEFCALDSTSTYNWKQISNF